MTIEEMSLRKEEKGSGLPQLTGSMLSYGAVPLIVVLSGGSSNPLLFAALYTGSGAIANAIYVLVKRSNFYSFSNLKQFFDTFISRKPFSNNPSIFNIFGERSFLVPISQFSALPIAWAFLYIPDIIATIILETWPIFFIFAIRREANRYYFTTRVASLFVLNFLAVALVVLSDTQDSAGISSSVLEYTFGLLLIVLAMLLYLQAANRVLQGERLSESICWSVPSEEELSEEDVNSRVTDVVIFLFLLSLVFTSVVSAVTYLIFETFDIFQNFSGSLNILGIVIALLGGALVHGLGASLFYSGTVKGNDLRVQSVAYFTPIVGILYLIIFSPLQETITGSEIVRGISDIDWPWFLIGSIGVLSITVIINFKSEEHRFGLTSLVIALWLSGALVYFRDDWEWWRINIDTPVVTNFEYFAFLGTSTTIFALLLGFQAARNEERARREDQLVFTLLDRLENLFSKSHYSRNEIYESLEKLDSAKYVGIIESNYDDIIFRLDNEISETVENSETNSKAEHVSRTKAVLNELAHSKQYGRRLSESVPIILLGLFSIFLAISFRPSTNGVSQAIAIDIFAFLLAAVISYLIFHLFDVYIDRKNSNFFHDKYKKSYNVKFLPSSSQYETLLASILVSAIVSSYVLLYFIKWLG